MDINLHIERLVLEGIDVAPGHNHLLQISVTNELTRLFVNNDLSSNIMDGGCIHKIKANNIHVPRKKNQTLGQQIAQAVYRGMRK